MLIAERDDDTQSGTWKTADSKEEEKEQKTVIARVELCYLPLLLLPAQFSFRMDCFAEMVVYAAAVIFGSIFDVCRSIAWECYYRGRWRCRKTKSHDPGFELSVTRCTRLVLFSMGLSFSPISFVILLSYIPLIAKGKMRKRFCCKGLRDMKNIGESNTR